MNKFTLVRMPSLTQALVVTMAMLPMFLMFKGIHEANGAFWASKAAPDTIVAVPEYPYLSCNKTIPVEFKSSFMPERIVIKRVQIDLPIKSVPLVDGTWKVYEGVANYAEGTSQVNANVGNVGIYAHDRKNGFTEIKKLTTGDLIEVYGGKYVATYQVVNNNTADPAAVNAFYPTEDPELTLVTCDGTFSEKRFIIRAKLSFIKELNCNETKI